MTKQLTRTARLVAALQSLGFREVAGRTSKYRTFQHSTDPTTYFLGRNGALRCSESGTVTSAHSLTGTKLYRKLLTAGDMVLASVEVKSRAEALGVVLDDAEAVMLMRVMGPQGALTMSHIVRGPWDRYDLSFTYTSEDLGVTTHAWLPKAAIAKLVRWTRPEVASMTDHPDMALAGDWSAVRDTEPERLWAIFRAHVLRQS